MNRAKEEGAKPSHKATVVRVGRGPASWGFPSNTPVEVSGTEVDMQVWLSAHGKSRGHTRTEDLTGAAQGLTTPKEWLSPPPFFQFDAAGAQVLSFVGSRSILQFVQYEFCQMFCLSVLG